MDARQADLGFIHRFVPAAEPAGALTLLLLHGTGGDERDLLDLGRLLAPDANLLSPRGKVLEGGAPRFFRRLAEGVFDLDDLVYRANELADFVAAAAASYGLDPARIVAAGYSNGANIAGALLLLRPGVLAGAALFRPMVPFVPDEPVALDGLPVFIAAGRQDPIVPPGHSEQLAALLRSFGAEVTLRWSPAGHGLTRDEVLAARDWLRQAAGS